jgi:hypothetical protein
MLTKRVARFLGARNSCGQTLQGSGIVNFRKLAARWTVALPAVFGGKIKVIAIGSRTWVNAPEFVRGRRHRRVWVELKTLADYRTFDHLTILRDVVVLTNPLRALHLLRSGRPPARPATDTAGARLTALPAASNKLTGSCAKDSSSVASNDSVNPKHLWTHIEIGSKIDGATISSWSKTTINATADKTGVCEVSESVGNVKADGYDFVIDFTKSTPTNPAIKGPEPVVTEKWKTIYHVKNLDCLPGTWSAEKVAGSSTETFEAGITKGDQGLQLTWDYSGIADYGLLTSIEHGFGPMVGAESAGIGAFVATPVGPAELLTFGGLGTVVFVAYPMALVVNCLNKELTVTQFGLVGGPRTYTLKKTSATEPPKVTVEQDWREEISTPVS